MTYQISYRCVECEQPAYIDCLELFEKHVWTYHLNDFAFHCAICGLPALSIGALNDHFNQQHDSQLPVEYKRKVEQENYLKSITSKSIVIIEMALNNFPNGENQPPASFDNENLSQITNNVFLTDHHDSVPTCSTLDTNIFQDAFENSVFTADNDNQNMEFVQNNDTLKDYDVFEHLEEIPNSSFAEYSNETNPPIIDQWGEKCQLNAIQGNIEGFSYVGEYQNPNEYENYDDTINLMENRYFSNKFKKQILYKCDICGKKLLYISKMEEHRRSHTGEKPFSCKHCDKSFTQRGALVCHERVHTGERPFVCSWECGRSFVSSSARVMHEKSHAGIRAFICRFCGKSFVKKYHVQRHEESRHKVKNSAPTGLDAAGDHLNMLRNTVTDVVESVQKSKKAKNYRNSQNILVKV